MKQLNFLVLYICAWPLFSTAQFMNNGATIVIGPGTQLTINNCSFENNGTFNQTAGIVNFTGSTAGAIGGTITPVFYNLNLNKPLSVLQLQNDIRINNELHFFNGLFNLDVHNLVLGPGALLINESVTSYAYGGSGGYIETTKLLNAPSADDPGNLGAVISSSQNLGSVIVRRGHQSQASSQGGSSILRYYDIIPANNASLNATLNFRYLDTELNGLNENLLTVWKSSDQVNWSNLSRTSNSTSNNQVQKTGIADFARFTLFETPNALPLVWGSFNTQCLSEKVRISWKTEQEENTSAFIVRRSPDARTWTTIATLPAAGNSSLPSSYAYIDAQPLASTNYYQIQERDIDGRLITSPVLINNCGTAEVLKVFPNPVQNNCWVSIQSTRAGSISMRLYDTKGALVYQRFENIQNGNNQFELRLPNVSMGTYSLVITLPDGTIKTVKIEKN